MDRLWSDTDGDKECTVSKTCPSVTFSTINPTLNGLELNPEPLDSETKGEKTFSINIEIWILINNRFTLLWML